MNAFNPYISSHAYNSLSCYRLSILGYIFLQKLHDLYVINNTQYTSNALNDLNKLFSILNTVQLYSWIILLGFYLHWISMTLALFNFAHILGKWRIVLHEKKNFIFW